MMNDFSAINGESEARNFATMTPEELAEYNDWLDEQEVKMDAN